MDRIQTRRNAREADAAIAPASDTPPASSRWERRPTRGRKSVRPS
jgi:hypothetical protein